MSSAIYIFSEGKLVKKDDSLSYEDKEGQCSPIPVYQVEDLYVLYKVEISPECLKMISKKGIAVHYFDKYEYYLGTYFPKDTATLNGSVLSKQAEAYNNIEKRIFLAKAFLTGCFKNINRIVKHYERKDNINTGNFDKTFDISISKINNSSTINQLMLTEAFFHKEYYKLWKQIFNKEVYFTKREFHPSYDLINSLISFLNALLYALIASEIYKTGLNPTISYLHEPSQSRLSLSFDIAEIFRPILVDKLIFKLINTDIIGVDDYDSENNIIKDDAVKKILKQWDDKINETIYHRELKRNVSYRYLIREELYKIVRHLKEEKEYKAFVMWW